MIHIVMKYWHVTSYHLVLRKKKKDRISDIKVFFDTDSEKTFQIIIYIVTLKVKKNVLR